jgi:hypothetical protein
VKPWSQKIEPPTWLDPPIQTYNDVGPKREGADHNMAEVGRFFFRTKRRTATGKRRSGLLFKSCLFGERWVRALALLGKCIEVSR